MRPEQRWLRSIQSNNDRKAGTGYRGNWRNWKPGMSDYYLRAAISRWSAIVPPRLWRRPIWQQHVVAPPILLDMLDNLGIEKAVRDLAADERPLVGAVIGASPPPLIGPFTRITSEEMDHFWKVNVDGPRQLLAGLIKGIFRKQKYGSAVFVLTSAMGSAERAPMSQMAAYLISKFGLMGVAEVIKAEYPWLSIQSVYPDFTETPMLNAFDPRFLDTMRGKSPFVAPQTVAQEIVEKISTNASL